jgi:hypothetical protein
MRTKTGSFGRAAGIAVVLFAVGAIGCGPPEEEDALGQSDEAVSSFLSGSAFMVQRPAHRLPWLEYQLSETYLKKGDILYVKFKPAGAGRTYGTMETHRYNGKGSWNGKSGYGQIEYGSYHYWIDQGVVHFGTEDDILDVHANLDEDARALKSEISQDNWNQLATFRIKRETAANGGPSSFVMLLCGAPGTPGFDACVGSRVLELGRMDQGIRRAAIATAGGVDRYFCGWGPELATNGRDRVKGWEHFRCGTEDALHGLQIGSPFRPFAN